MSKIKVCHITHGIVGSGVEQVIFNYCSRMTDVFEFDILYQYEPNPDILKKFQDAGFNCIQVPDKVRHPLKHLWKMFQNFRKGHYDVVHSHLDWYMNSYVCFLAKLAGVKKRIAHHHQAYSKWRFLCAIMRIPCKLFATHWLACGEAAASNGWGKHSVEKGKVTILPNAIDPERFKFNENARQEIRERYGIKGDDFVVGHVGRFYPQKNHKFLIDVFAKLHKQRANAKLLLLGEGPLLGHIKQTIDSFGLSNVVIFAGLQKDPTPFYSAMDVFAFPSLWEGLPLTLIEAQYNGLCCFVSEYVTKEAGISPKTECLPLDLSLWVSRISSAKGKSRILQEPCSDYDIAKQLPVLKAIYAS